MSLYKYLPPERLDVLARGMIRFTQPAALNDPFEFRPLFDSLFSDEWVLDQIRGKKIDVASVFREAYEEQPAAIKEKVSFDQVFALAKVTLQTAEGQAVALGLMNNLLETLQGMTPHLRASIWKELGSRVGILSLAERPDSPTMWAHYADSHRGYVIEFDEAHSFFNRKRSDNDEFFHVRRVAYDVPPAGRALADLDGTDFFLRKSSEWREEREWRMLVPLKTAVMKIGQAEEAIHLFAVPPACVSSVILGARARTDFAAEVQKVVEAPHHGHVVLRRAELDDHTQGIKVSLVR